MPSVQASAQPDGYALVCFGLEGGYRRKPLDADMQAHHHRDYLWLHRTSEPYSGFPRWLVSIVMEEGAVLLAGPSPSGGVSPDFQVCTTIDDASHQGCPELILDTILELLKLSGRQNEPEMWSQSIDVPSHHYHLRLTFTRETYHAFTERVSQVVLRMS
jgi:hypothetical protein